MKKQTLCSIRMFTLIAVMCVAITACSQPAAVKQSESEKTATLSISAGKVRSEPSKDAPVIFELKKGDTISVIEETDGWYHLKTQDGKTGWSHKSLFSVNSGTEDAGFKEVKDIRVEKISDKEEKVTFVLNGFNPPKTSLLREEPSEIVCDFPETRISGSIKPIIEVNGRYLKRIQAKILEETPSKLRVVLAIVSNRRYSVKQTFYKKENYYTLTLKEEENEKAEQPIKKRISRGRGSAKVVVEKNETEEATQLNQQVENLHKQGRFAEAVPIAQKALSIREKVLGTEHPYTAVSLNSLAELYKKTGDYAKAEPLYQRALQICEKKLGLEHPDTASMLHNMADFYDDMGGYAKAEQLYQRALQIREKVLGAEHADTSTSLNNLGFLYYQTLDYAKAEPLFKRALEIREKVLGDEHPDTANSLHNLAVIYEKLGEYTKAELLYQRTLQIREKVLGAEHTDTAMSLNNLAWLYDLLGDYAKAESLYQRTLQIREKVLGAEHPDTAQSLNNLAVTYEKLSDYTKAEQLLKRALQIREKVLGAEHTDTAMSLNNLAWLYDLLGDYAKAESLYQRALQILEKSLDAERFNIVAPLNGLAILYKNLGDYKKAEPLYQKALQICEKILGNEHPDTAATLNNLAGLYQQLGDYAKAEPLYKRALQIWEKVLGTEHPNIAASMSSMAVFYKQLGDYAKAEPLYQKALQICEKILGNEHPDTAATLNNLAGLYQQLGDYAKAEPLYKRALQIWEKSLGIEHIETARGMNNLAAIYKELNDYAKAESLFKRALQIKEKTLGVEHPDTAATLHNLAGLYEELGDHAKAESLYKRALQIKEKFLSTEHPDTKITLSNLGILYARSDDFEKAHHFLKQVQEIDEKLIDQVMGFTSEDQKTKFIGTKKSYLYHFFSLVIRHLTDKPSAKKEALDVWLKRKGIILESQKKFQEMLAYSDNPEAQTVFEEYSSVRAQLAKLFFAGPGKEGPEVYQKNKAKLEAERQNLEAKMSRLSQAFASKQKTAKADTEKIAKALPADAVLLEFAKADIFTFKAQGKEKKWEPEHYLAFVLHAGKPEDVSMIDLGEAEKIDASVANFKKWDPTIPKRDITAAQELYNLVFKPVRSALGSAKTIFISPDGNLNLIPFESFMTPDGKFLIEEYTFNYLTAGRDILAFGEITEKGGAPLLIGDPDFDMETSPPPDLQGGGKGTRSADMRGFRFKRLPGTLTEVSTISSLMGQDKALLYTDKQALDEVLMKAGTPRILHLATHGFFLKDQDLSSLQDDDIRGGMLSETPARKSSGVPLRYENPLLRSGIALAGANKAILKEGDSQGIVTADKILELKLRGTDMVVLSACETGLGDVQSGEGVYGLRRAFVQAGAKSLVMSLWSVPDAETKEFMTLFYRNLLSGKMSKMQAFRDAVLKQKEVVKQRYGKPSPFYWAAFVFLGEPGDSDSNHTN